MKRQFLRLIVMCTLLGVGTIVVLKINNNNPYANIKNNNFNRLIKNSVLSNAKKTDIKYNSYYLVGLSSDKIFLGNSTVRSHILVSDYKLQDTLHMRLENPNNYKIAWKYANMYIDFPDIYLYERISPRILHSKYPSSQLTENYDLGNNQFSKLVPISPNAFVLRRYDTYLQQNTLVINKKDVSQLHTPDKPVLKKQVDGWFCTDGMLHYSPEMSRLVYLYYYRNQFITLDTNLNVIYTGKTIDTVSNASFKLDTIHSKNSITYSAPRLIVNRKSCVSKDKLFVYSKLIADNEDSELFNNNSIIDIYNLEDGKYQFSFYIPNYKKYKMKDFKVFEQKLVVIYDHYLATFDLDY